MNKKKRHILRISLLTVVMLGAVIALAYFNSKDSANNIFTFGNKYTLTYHANTESTAEDGKVTNLPGKDTKYGDGKSSVEFTVSSDKPVRPGFVFTGWYEKATPDTATDNKYGPDGIEKYTATADQYESNLYAQWQAGYTLIYDANRPPDEKGGNAPATVTRKSDNASETFDIAGKGQLSWLIDVDGEETDEYRVFLGWSENKNATEPDYTDTGSWARTSDLDSSYNVGSTKKTITIDAAATPSKTKTLYAVWANKYVLEYKKHPEMINPAVGAIKTPTQVLVTPKDKHVFTIPDETDEIRPSRAGGYEWGWWGDTLERFGYSKEAASDSPVNEGCYIFGDTVKELKKDSPKLVLYAYFQPPNDVTINYDKNTTRSTMPSSTDYNAAVTNLPKTDYGYSRGEIYFYPVGGLSSLVPEHPRYVFQGWATTPDATKKEYDPGDKEFKVNIVLNNNVTLYAVWKAGHNYRLYFHRNGGDRVYRKNEAVWGYYGGNLSYNSDDPVGMNTDPKKFFTESSYTWDKDFFSDRGVFATRADTNSTSGAWTYTFLGWSLKQQEPKVDAGELTVDFKVKAPEPKDKANPNPLEPDLESITGDMGLITENVKFDEPNASCTTPTKHDVYLYAVWKKSPKHQLALEFNKGGASNNLSNNTYYEPSSTGYVASDKLISKTWTADDLSSLTVPVKNDEDTATYEFLGWTKKNTSELPGGIGTASDVDVRVDPVTKKVAQPITVREPKNNPGECDGGQHKDVYYPVFKKTARHKFVVNYDVNAPSKADSVETYIYSSDTPDVTSSWSKKKVKGGSPETGDIEAAGNLYSKTEPLSVRSYTHTLNGKGWFATCVNTSPNATSTYTFLGWATEKFDVGEFDPENEEHKKKFFPVTAPEDPNTPDSGEGTLARNLVISDDNPESVDGKVCSEDDNEGNVHEQTLYGVWAGEKLHQFSVVFVANADDAPNQKIIHGSKQNWENGGDALAESGDTIKKNTEDFKGTALDSDGDGKLDNDLPNTWRTFSDALRMPADASDPEYSKEYTFDKDFWNGNGKDLIVKAKAGDSSSTRYKFKGWATTANALVPNVSIDTDGYITTDLTVDSDDYPCDSKTHHIVLYGVWEKTQLHNYQILFYAKDGNGLSVSAPIDYKYYREKASIVGVMNPENLPNDRYLYYTGIAATQKDVAKDYGSHTWKITDANPLKATATHADTTESGNRYKWIFKGWAETPDGPAEYPVDDNGYLTKDVSITAPHGSNEGDCDSYTHTKVLYAIWDKELIPKTHRFALTFDLNGGTYFRKYNAASGKWSDSSTRTFYDDHNGSYYDVDPSVTEYCWTADYFSDNGIGGARRNADDRWTYEFVGWSETRVAADEDPDMSGAIQWQHDPSSDEAGDGLVSGALTAACSDYVGNHNAQDTTHTKTVYAIWKRAPRSKTYELKFEGNPKVDTDTVDNVPNPITGTETFDNGEPAKWNTHTFDITSTSRPVYKELIFAGWSENPDANKGEYGVPYQGADEDQRSLTANLTPLFTTSPAVSDGVKEVKKTLYAIWLYEYRLTYNGNGGSNTPPHIHAYDKKDQKTTQLRDVVPSREGYTFVEWNTKADGSGDSYDPGQQITMQAEDNGKKIIILYAVWQKNE